jgi:DNA-binding transcriptional MerR regulator
MFFSSMYSTREVAEMLGVSKDTLLRWLREKKVPEPSRDEHGFRVFNRGDLETVWRYISERRARVLANKMARNGRG